MDQKQRLMYDITIIDNTNGGQWKELFIADNLDDALRFARYRYEDLDMPECAVVGIKRCHRPVYVTTEEAMEADIEEDIEDVGLHSRGRNAAERAWKAL